MRRPASNHPLLKFFGALLAALACAGPVCAQAWPSKPVRFIVAVPSGIGPDIIARLLSERLQKHFGQPFLVDNIAGAGGIIGTQTLARAAPDGYTIMLAGVGALVIDPYIKKEPGYEPDRDLVPVGFIYEQDRLSVALHPDVPAKTLPELIQLAKAQPGKISYGVTNGVLPIMVGQWINKLAGTDMVQVVYKAGGQQMQDLLSNRIQWIVGSPPQLDSFVKAGKLRVVATDGVGRYAAWPDVPLISETFPGYRTSGMGIMVGPRGFPASVLQPLNAAMDKINRDPEYVQRLLALGVSVNGAGAPEAINGYIRERRSYWTNIFKTLNVPPGSE